MRQVDFNKRVYLVHRGIQCELTEVRDGIWRWSFVPPVGSSKSAQVIGGYSWAMTVAQRAIDIWHTMNPGYEHGAPKLEAAE